METTAKFKKLGGGGWSDRNIILPDFYKPLFETYKLEIIEYRELRCMGVFFQRKDSPNKDVVSHTIYHPEIQVNIENGFRTLFERLNELMTAEITQPYFSGFNIISH